MKLAVLLALLLFLCVPTQAQVTARRLFSGSANPNSTPPVSICVPGPPVTDLYFRTSDQTLWACTTAPSTYTQVSGSGGSGTINSGTTNQVPYYTAVTTLSGDAGLTYNSGTDTLTAGTFTGNASASNLNAGTVPDARLSSDIMRLATAQTVTTAKSFNDSMLKFVGGAYGASDTTLPAVVANALLLNTDSNRWFIGRADGSSWDALFRAGVDAVNLASANVTGILPKANGGTGAASFPYDLTFNFEGEPGASAIIPVTVVRAFNSGAAWAGTVCSAQVAATAQTDFLVKKNGSTVATLRFAASGTTCTLVSASTTSFVAGDVIVITAPATPDATLSDVAISLLGSLN